MYVEIYIDGGIESFSFKVLFLLPYVTIIKSFVPCIRQVSKWQSRIWIKTACVALLDNFDSVCSFDTIDNDICWLLKLFY